MRALSPILGVEQAGRVFSALAMLMPALGATVLSRVIHGRWSLVSLVGFALCMNGLVAWGFLDYVFGVGIAFLGVAGWIVAGPLGRLPRIAVFFVVIFVASCIHLLAGGISSASSEPTNSLACRKRPTASRSRRPC